MKSTILFITIALVALSSATLQAPDFCPRAPHVKPTVVPKKELCPGSRSVEDILKELACVQNTIVELTTALVTYTSSSDGKTTTTTTTVKETPKEDQSPLKVTPIQQDLCPKSSVAQCAPCKKGEIEAGKYIMKAYETSWFQALKNTVGAGQTQPKECPVFECFCKIDCPAPAPCKLSDCPVGSVGTGGILERDETTGCHVYKCQCVAPSEEPKCAPLNEKACGECKSVLTPGSDGCPVQTCVCKDTPKCFVHPTDSAACVCEAPLLPTGTAQLTGNITPEGCHEILCPVCCAPLALFDKPVCPQGGKIVTPPIKQLPNGCQEIQPSFCQPGNGGPVIMGRVANPPPVIMGRVANPPPVVK